MEQPFSKDEHSLEDLMNEAGLEHPSSSFSSTVMDAIEAKSNINVYQPLISTRAWIVGISVLLAIVVFVNVVPVVELGLFENFNVTNLGSLGNSFEGLSIPNTSFYAICLLGLFWVQIPFLKRWMNG